MPPSSLPLTYASIMVAADSGPEAENRIKLAASLADRFSSRLIGVAAQEIVAPLYFESPADGVISIIELERRRATEDMAKAGAIFQRIANSLGELEWRKAFASPSAFVAEQSRAADLIVVSRPGRDEPASSSFNAGDIVMNAGRPVLLVPPGIDFLSAQRIVIGWKDSREARRAIWDSLPFLKGAAEVSVVAVDSEEQAANDIGAYLRRHGVTSSVFAYSKPGASAADELIRVAKQEGADLIVCGAYGHSRTREWVFGGVTHDLFDHSPVCCLMSH